MAGGQAAAASVVASGATAVIAHNDLMALGIMAGAAALGVEVPTDLSVVGIDDTPLAEVSRPTLTSIQVPMSRAGVMSVDMLHQQLTAEAPVARDDRSRCPPSSSSARAPARSPAGRRRVAERSDA